jgi:hypothetical protein
VRVPALLGIGLLKCQAGAYAINGFVFRGHFLRDSAAVSLALMKADGTADRIADTLKASGGSAAAADTVMVAALATIDPERGAKLGREMLEKTLRRPGSETAGALAFTFALAGDEASLEKLANHEDPSVRAGTARGIAWASLTTTGMAAPSCLSDLRLDVDPWVQLEGAIAAGYLHLGDCLPDIARALTLPETILSGQRPGPPSLATLAGTEGIKNGRQALWEAYDANVRGSGLAWRPSLSAGRVYEREREIREKANKR